MLNLTRMGSESKNPLLKGGYHTSSSLHTIIRKVGPIGHIAPEKQFPNFINRSNSYQNHKMDQASEINSCPQIWEIPKHNPITNNQVCNSNKKKKKKRKRKKKKSKNNQSQSTAYTMENSIDKGQSCCRQRQLSTTESEDSFVVFFDETLGDNDRISELSENETVVTEDFDSSDSIVPHKKVRFADELCEIHPMVMWSYAYQAARKGPWEEYARDRDRFHKRVENVEADISHVFSAEHRSRIYKERFA